MILALLLPVLAEDLPLPQLTPSAEEMSLYSARYLQHRHMATGGLIASGVGVGATAVGAGMFIGSLVNATAQNDPNELKGIGGGVVLVILGSGTTLIGGGVLSLGGVMAAHDLQNLGRSTALWPGYTSLGLLGGGLAVAIAGASSASLEDGTSPVSTVGRVMMLGGFATGVGQWFYINSEGADIRQQNISLVPNLNPRWVAQGAAEPAWSLSPGLSMVGVW